jgi:hypothetical protein
LKRIDNGKYKLGIPESYPNFEPIFDQKMGRFLTDKIPTGLPFLPET